MVLNIIEVILKCEFSWCLDVIWVNVVYVVIIDRISIKF